VRTVVAALATSAALATAGGVSAESPHQQPRASKNWQKIVTFKGAEGQVCRDSSHYKGHKAFQTLVRFNGRRASSTVSAKSHIESNGYPASDSWHPTVRPGHISATDLWAGSGAHKSSGWDRWIDIDHC
jgi:hypothetical protein